MKYHEVSFKGSHNSYDRDEAIHQQLTWFDQAPAQCGCRGVEFDIWRHSDQVEKYFTVSHDDPYGGYPLAYYLGLLLSYHLNEPAHDVIFVTLDIKSSDGPLDTFPDEIDTYLSEYFHGDFIFTPAMLFTNKDLSLCQNVIEFGWPDTKAMQGKFVFCLSGNTDWKSFYAASKIKTRLCFSDKDVNDTDTSFELHERENFVVFNMHIFSDDFSDWKKLLPLFFERNFLTRVYVANSDSLWTKALHASASVIATDEISGKSWAAVGASPFGQRVND